MQTYTIKLSESCEKRPIRFLDYLTHHGWTLKVYGISYESTQPCPKLLKAAYILALETLPSLNISLDHYYLGYMGVHDGRGINFVFIDWWANENELYHCVFTSPKHDSGNFTEASSRDPIACIWDLKLIAFERDAWVKTVLRNPTGPDT
jgi:hypothetical protein